MIGSVSRRDLVSPRAIAAYRKAQYHLRHYIRFVDWTDEQRATYCLNKAFDAALTSRQEREYKKRK